MSGRLVAIGLRPGERFVSELRRAFDEGDAVAPIDSRLGAPAVARLLEALRPALLVTKEGERRPLRSPQPVAGDDALVLATSGTTGEPKGVVLTHQAIEASARATNRRLEVDVSTDRWWCCLPLAHVGGLSVVLRSLEAGVACDVEESFSTRGAAEAIARGASLVSLVPTALRRLDADVVGAFRRVVLGGQAPPESLPGNVVTTYGMTETGSGVVYDGRPLDGVEVRITEGDGEVCLRGPMLLRAYRDGSDPKDEEGWLPTGDSGRLGPGGLLEVDGRLSELVITGGENVWPAAVEAVLQRHVLVREAAVAGRADPEWGEHVTAFVVGEGDLEGKLFLAELRELVSGELASYAAPRELVIVKELPRTSLGKLRRDRLFELEGPSFYL